MGRKKLDLVGQRFSRLTVIEKAGLNKQGKSQFLCKCDCGNEKIVSGNSLKREYTKSCGCLNRRLELIGKRFGRLLVIEFAYVKNQATYWKCLCDCGNEKIICAVNLKGTTKSCGCLKSENGKAGKINLAGKKFNLLSVISETGRNKRNRILWNCICECGNTCVVLGEALKSGGTKSCGCLNHRKGKDNPGYNPNLTEEDRQNRRRIPGYNKWRKAVFKRDNYTCQVCGDSTGGNLNAHHIESYNNNPDLRTKLSNGATTCDKCHGNFHHQYGYGNNTREQFEEFKGGFK